MYLSRMYIVKNTNSSLLRDFPEYRQFHMVCLKALSLVIFIYLSIYPSMILIINTIFTACVGMQETVSNYRASK